MIGNKQRPYHVCANGRNYSTLRNAFIQHKSSGGGCWIIVNKSSQLTIFVVKSDLKINRILQEVVVDFYELNVLMHSLTYRRFGFCQVDGGSHNERIAPCVQLRTKLSVASSKRIYFASRGPACRCAEFAGRSQRMAQGNLNCKKIRSGQATSAYHIIYGGLKVYCINRGQEMGVMY